MILLTEKPLDPEAITRTVRKPSSGGIVTFLGTTRDITHGKRVLYLEYEAYQDMAQKTLGQIIDDVRTKWGVVDVAIAHRTGRLEVGEISLVVAVASPHRKEAFRACQYIVDRVKTIVPIWKKEVFEGGEVWVGTEEEYAEVEEKG